MPRWIIFALAFPLTGCFNGLLLTPTQVGGPLSETVMADSECCLCLNKVAVIDVEGIIMNARTSGLFGSGENPLSLFREKLDAAAEDPRVKAVVLRINSPGGAVTASDIMYQDLLSFRHDTHKPVVACMMDVAASGAYYLAMGCDVVYAHPTTVTGSIGVIMSLYNASGLLHEARREQRPDQVGTQQGHRQPGPAHDRRGARHSARHGKQLLRPVRPRRRGRPALARGARTGPGRWPGLHGTGRRRSLAWWTRSATWRTPSRRPWISPCIKDATVVAYDRCDGYRGSIYAGMPKIPSQINVKLDVPGLPSRNGAAFMYLWEPGAPQ